jgi:hypothetical protein
MFTNAELVKSETINGRLQLTVRGIFHAIKDIECYNTKLFIIVDKKTKEMLLEDMALFNTGSNSYESVKGMFDKTVEEIVIESAMRNIYQQQIA